MPDLVLSVGGSLIAPGKVNVDFIKEFKKLMLDFTSAGNRVLIVAGGGATARDYIKAAQDVSDVISDDLDWLGIRGTMINAELLRAVFGDSAYPRILTNPTEKLSTSKRIVVASGWKPGWSSDYDAVLLAENFKVGTVVNMTNVDYVYDKNPKEFKDAKPLKQLTWDDMKKIVGEEWHAGLNAPFDPIASKLASALKLKVVVLNGNKLENFKNFLLGKNFVGSIIE